MDAGWIAVAALLVAVATAIAEGLSRRRQHHLAQEQLDLAKRLGAIEERRREEEVEKRKQANVIAHFERRDKDGRGQPCLVVTNNGPADAFDLAITVREVATSRSVKLLKVWGEDDTVMPFLERLSAGRSIRFDLGIGRDVRYLGVLIAWVDERLGSELHQESRHIIDTLA